MISWFKPLLSNAYLCRYAKVAEMDEAAATSDAKAAASAEEAAQQRVDELMRMLEEAEQRWGACTS